MPAPVEFSVRLAALTPGFTGDPQALASEIAERLIITPSEPWSSFINGGAQPSSNVGPYLKNGQEWLVWSDALGTYTYHTQNGAGLVDATVTLAKLADGTPKSVLSYDTAGRPALISGTAGQTLQLNAAGVPVFATPVTANYFKMGVSTAQDYSDDGVAVPVQFDLNNASQGVTPDLVNYRVPVTAGSVWFFFASLQIESINGGDTSMQHYIGIRPYQNTAIGLGSIHTNGANVSRDGINTSGIYYFVADGYVDVVVGTSGPAAGLKCQISPNGNSTRFEGYRLQ